MQNLKRSALRPTRPPTGRSATARVMRAGMVASLALFVLTGLALGILVIRLSAGPMSVGQVTDRLAASLSEQIGAGWTVALRDTSFHMRGREVALRATGLDIRNPEGGLVLRTPEALVSIDALSLFTARIRPRSMEFRDLQVRLVLNRNGSLSFTPSPEIAGEAPPPTVSRTASSGTAAASPVLAPARTADQAAAEPAPVDPALVEASAISTGVASLFDMLVGPSGLLGFLDQAQIADARLTMVDSAGRERATFKKVAASFERTPEGGRHFEATLDGPGGVWRLEGEADPDGSGGYRGTVRGQDAPLQDLLLLSGLSGIPADTDLKVSGQANATMVGGRVETLRARMLSQKGEIRIHDKDTTPIPVDGIALDAAWEEGRRALVLRNIDFRGPATRLVLQGELASPGDPDWSLAITGRESVINGAIPGDAPVSLDSIEARLTGRDGLVVEKLSLRGPTLSVDLDGSFGAGADPKAIRANGVASNSSVRSILRLWPEAVAPPIRKFLLGSLKAGRVERMAMAVAMTGEDLARATAQQAIPEASVKVDFAIREGEFVGAEGLPPLVGATINGRSGGVKALIQVPSARVAMPDRRFLNATGGQAAIATYWTADSAAKIDFRLEGGADALASLLHTPIIKEIGVPDFDPASIRGRSDLKVALSLPFPNVPRITELPLSVNGAVADLSVDKVFGRDRLDNGNLAVSYDRGSLAIKGAGRIAGSPAQIEVSQPRGQAGEAVLVATLDDAARARRGMSFGSQLAGPVTLKAALPLGKAAKPGVRIEVDLAKAAINGLIPGWTKPAGRPGKLAFVYVEREKEGSELRDLSLDSGTTQVRGSAVLTSDGQLDRADLPTFKLSPGDDMKVQIERNGGAVRAVVRGNVGDARPYAKVLATPSQGGRGPAPGKGDARDLDLDLALNILTGHNDEAITGAVLKASVRGGNLRQLQLQGRLGAAPLMAQTSGQSGQQVLSVQTENAGSLLRFLDIYRRMSGGRLNVQTGLGEGAQAGSLVLNDFSLRNEPALSRIVPGPIQVVSANDRSPEGAIDVNDVAFSKAKAEFTRSAGRLEFKDAAIFGPSVGFTMEGALDFAKDQVEVSGTFTPAYALNNLVANFPVFGQLFTGGRNEGVIGVNFRLSGPIGQPNIIVNPVSAVAPGIFRKMFGTGTGDPNAPPAYNMPDRQR